MSSNMNLDLDFRDYAPQQAEETSRPDLGQQKPEVVIKIPDNKRTSATTPKQQTPNNNQKNTLGSILQNVTNFPTSGPTDEALRQFIRISSKQRQQQQPPPGNAGFSWGLNYFSQYFDVTTSDVLERILWSAVPIRKTGIDLDNLDDSDLIAPLTRTDVDGMSSFASGIDSGKLQQSLKGRPYSYMERFIQSRPDLYGPFWVSVTLVFTVAIFSNISSFSHFRTKELDRINLVMANNPKVGNQTVEATSEELVYNMDGWHYSMEELNMTTSAVMMYVTLLPTFLWFLFWFRGCTKYYTLTETICAYGYSISIFIPLSLLLLIQANIFRYIVLSLAALLSGLVLLLSFVPIIQSDPNPTGSRIVLALVPACHFGLAYIIHRIMLQ